MEEEGGGGRFSLGSRGGWRGRGYIDKQNKAHDSEADQSDYREYDPSGHYSQGTEDGRGYEAGTETFDPGDNNKGHEEDDVTEEEMEEMAKQSEMEMDLDKEMQQGHNTPTRKKGLPPKSVPAKTRAQKKRAAMTMGGEASCDGF